MYAENPRIQMVCNVSVQDMLSKITIFVLLQFPMSVNKGLNYIKLDLFKIYIFCGFHIKNLSFHKLTLYD